MLGKLDETPQRKKLGGGAHVEMHNLKGGGTISLSASTLEAGAGPSK
jgi:hypothetical protein